MTVDGSAVVGERIAPGKVGERIPLKGADSPVGGRGGAPLERGRGRPAAEAALPVAGMARRVRLRAVLVGVLIALIAMAASAGLGLALAQAFFGTTGGIL